MTILTIIGVLVLGLLLLVTGLLTKKNWLKILSIIPLAVAGWQFALMFAMG